MIGILTAGHGRFATGAVSALTLVLGNQEGLEAVDFPAGDTLTELQEHIDEALKRLEDTEHILAFSDILGGSPFNTLIDRAMRRGGITVYYGTNVGMLIDTVMRRNSGTELKSLTADIVPKGKEQVGMFSPETAANAEDDF